MVVFKLKQSLCNKSKYVLKFYIIELRRNVCHLSQLNCCLHQYSPQHQMIFHRCDSSEFH